MRVQTFQEQRVNQLNLVALLVDQLLLLKQFEFQGAVLVWRLFVVGVTLGFDERQKNLLGGVFSFLVYFLLFVYLHEELEGVVVVEFEQFFFLFNLEVELVDAEFVVVNLTLDVGAGLVLGFEIFLVLTDFAFDPDDVVGGLELFVEVAQV